MDAPKSKTSQPATPKSRGRSKKISAGLRLREHLVAEAVSYLSGYPLEITKDVWPFLFEFCEYISQLLKRFRDPIALARVRGRFTQVLESADEVAPGLLKHLMDHLRKLSWHAILYRKLPRLLESQSKPIEEFTDEVVAEQIRRRLGWSKLAPDTLCKTRQRLGCRDWYRFELCIRACVHVLNSSDSSDYVDESKAEWISVHKALPCLEFIGPFLDSVSPKRAFHRTGTIEVGPVLAPELCPRKERKAH